MNVVVEMDKRHISQVPVVSGGNVIGLGTPAELLAAVERHLAHS